MSQVIYNYKLLDLKGLDWSKSYEELGLDEYEWTAILTSIEHEFHTVFEDRVFESFNNFQEIQGFIARDHNCFWETETIFLLNDVYKGGGKG